MEKYKKIFDNEPETLSEEMWLKVQAMVRDLTSGNRNFKQVITFALVAEGGDYSDLTGETI